MNVKNHCIGRRHLSVAKFRRQNFFEKKLLCTEVLRTREV